MLNQGKLNIEEYSSNNISIFWNLLNFSNDIVKKQLANIFFSNLKEKYKNYFEISIELFNKSNSSQDKLISSILIYQYIKENYNKFIENEILFNNTKQFLLNILNTYINDSKINIFSNSEETLIIERICLSISIILLIGCFTYWPQSIEDILNFGKYNINSTYLTTLIIGNCNEEINDMFLSKSQENKIKEKFVENKENLKSFINTILLSSNIDKKLYNKTIDLSRNLVIFEINILHIPKMIKVLLENSNKSNIDSIYNLISKCIEYSKCKKLEDDLSGLDLSEYNNKMNKDELNSINLIIEYIYFYINNNTNDRDMIFGFGKILGDILENYIYLMFKKDNISQKLLKLFFFFITNKKRIVSQLFFESVLIMKNFINACYQFNNYSDEEKVEFSNYLLKICQNIIINCTYKKIENQEILLKNENICINHNQNEEEKNIGKNENNEINMNEEIDEIQIYEYRANAEDLFFNIFLIFAINFQLEGVNYFFKTITEPIIPLISKKISEISLSQILTLESIIYSIKSLVNAFETLTVDKSPLIEFIILLMKSDIIKHDFIFSNFLLLIEEVSTFFDSNNKICSEIITFLLENINDRINQKNQDTYIQLCTAVLLSLCESCENIYNNNIWEKMFYIYKNYFNIFIDISLYNMTESICSSIISQEDVDGNNNIPFNKFDCFKNIMEIPLINMKNICEIINNKNRLKEKEKEELLRKEIKKNINVITRILKQISFIKDKSIFNSMFNLIYSTSFSYIIEIIKEYINNSDIIKPFLKMLIKSSNYLNIETVNKIFPNLNQFLIEIFLNNKDNFESIYVLKNLYFIKLKNMNNNEKTIQNKEYYLILDNFIGLNREICSVIINKLCPDNQLELIQSLSTMFYQIFPLLDELRNDDYIVINDTIIIFIEGIKLICDNNIIKNILNAFICLIKSKKKEIIQSKLNDIIFACFNSIEHYNNLIINSFVEFCCECLNYNKDIFMNVLNQILYSNDFKILNDKYKKIVIAYFDFYSSNSKKLKNIIFDLVNISKKINVPEILEEYHNDLINNKNDYFHF